MSSSHRSAIVSSSPARSAQASISCVALAAAARVLLHGRFAGMERGGLLLILLFYCLAPAVASIPILNLKGVESFSAAYFEMASALTTTGATIFWNVDLVPDSVILWRAILAGFGGLVCLVSALAILAPLSIGGFEVDHSVSLGFEDCYDTLPYIHLLMHFCASGERCCDF